LGHCGANILRNATLNLQTDGEGVVRCFAGSAPW